MTLTLNETIAGCYRVGLYWERGVYIVCVFDSSSISPVSERYYKTKKQAIRGFRYYVSKHKKECE